MAEVILIAVNGDDIASTNQAKFLLENNPWEQQDDVESHPSYAIGNVRMWFLPKRILWEDHLDQRWCNATGENVTEVIFPSRHAAVSGQPCLTLHPLAFHITRLEKSLLSGDVPDLHLHPILELLHGGDYFTRNGKREPFRSFLSHLR